MPGGCLESLPAPEVPYGDPSGSLGRSGVHWMMMVVVVVMMMMMMHNSSQHDLKTIQFSLLCANPTLYPDAQAILAFADPVSPSLADAVPCGVCACSIVGRAVVGFQRHSTANRP